MNITERKTKIQRYASVGLVALAALVVSPIIFLIIKGVIGLAIAAVVGVAIATTTPVISMKFANWRVRAITNEARENPIETLTNLIQAKQRALNVFEESVVEAVTARADFAIKCSNFSIQYPHRAAEFSKQLESMTIAVDKMKQALSEARDSLVDGNNKLTEMRAYWDMSQAAQVANKATGMDTGDMYEKLKLDTAVDAVYESMNRAFAQLEVAAVLDSGYTTKQQVQLIEHNDEQLIPGQLFALHKEKVNV
jgi:hypothetical protein